MCREAVNQSTTPPGPGQSCRLYRLEFETKLIMLYASDQFFKVFLIYKSVVCVKIKQVQFGHLFSTFYFYLECNLLLTKSTNIIYR